MLIISTFNQNKLYEQITLNENSKEKIDHLTKIKKLKMKKFLSIFAGVLLFTASASIVISCSKKYNENDSPTNGKSNPTKVHSLTRDLPCIAGFQTNGVYTDVGGNCISNLMPPAALYTVTTPNGASTDNISANGVLRIIVPRTNERNGSEFYVLNSSGADIQVRVIGYVNIGSRSLLVSCKTLSANEYIWITTCDLENMSSNFTRFHYEVIAGDTAVDDIRWSYDY